MNSFNITSSLILIVVLLVGYIGYRFVKTKHVNNPDYEREREERERESNRRAAENEELDNYINSFDEY